VRFEILGEIIDPETIAAGFGIRKLKSLRTRHGGQNWRKRKGSAMIRLKNGSIRWAELHWYEGQGVGRIGWKIKRFLD
jgi:hypothetical protein